jgi:3-hydroxyisobutyrate dehydrogenase-like beta-hydroxyacid dehydrogenase
VEAHVISRIALIGFGEVGSILASDLSRSGVALAAFDLKFGDPRSGPSKAVATAGVRTCANAGDAVARCELVISAVTAAQTLAAAQSVGARIGKDAIFLDLNSASPGVKREAADAIHRAGGRYIEAAVMSPVPPKRIATPMLLGGPHAEAFLPELQKLGFAGADVFSGEIGKASAAKMCRSVMVKGIEALLSESMLAARAYGVEETVLKSLDDLFPGPDWTNLSRYMISRTLEHGTRRAEEMREVARTVAEAGLDPHMSSAAAERQAWAPQFAAALSEQELADMLDAIRALMDAKTKGAAA